LTKVDDHDVGMAMLYSDPEDTQTVFSPINVPKLTKIEFPSISIEEMRGSGTSPRFLDHGLTCWPCNRTFIRMFLPWTLGDGCSGLDIGNLVGNFEPIEWDRSIYGS
jgi:hypothetical protein